MCKIPVELMDEYIDLCVMHDSLENDTRYAKKIKYYETLDEELYERLHTVQDKIIKLHPYFKRRDTVSCWSAGDLEFVTPVKKGGSRLNKVQLRYGGGWGRGHESKIVKDPIGLDMFALAEELIWFSGDLHHTFVEGFKYSHDENDVSIYELVTGS